MADIKFEIVKKVGANSPLCPSAISPKYDNENSGHIVVFRGECVRLVSLDRFLV